MKSTGIPLNIDNIDTDQIIPAEFLKTTQKEDFGSKLFYHWRFRTDGSANDESVFNDGKYTGNVLIVGNNFGCGSSREHAAWALADYGFKAIISAQFADIFKGNALNNKILPIELKDIIVRKIIHGIEAFPDIEIEIDLPQQLVIVKELAIKEYFEINSFHKECILKGIDSTQYLINMRERINEFENQLNA